MPLKTISQLLFFCSFPILSFALSIERDVQYSQVHKGKYNKLDIYYPKIKGKAKDVIIFIHGGSWRSGSKKEYWWLGRNFGHKNTLAVIINYPLSPKSQYQEMAFDCAEAVKWVQSNILKFGGNPKRIFLMGHSAGGHLATLINQDPRYFDKTGILNPVKGVILIDAFGLDMYQYITNDPNGGYVPSFKQTFSLEENAWKEASPLNYIKTIPSPYLILVGKKTFPTIQLQSHDFYTKINQVQKNSKLLEIKGKKHVAMITQLILGCNKTYTYILDFIKSINN